MKKNIYIQNTEALKFDTSNWNYDNINNVYWQLGVCYCSNPETIDYETMSIYIPGSYMDGTYNGDGTYTCKINKKCQVNNYSSSTAPIVFPINTPKYSAHKSPILYNYDSISNYINEGIIYVEAGMRGKNDTNINLTCSSGSPWGVTNLKAAIRYYKFNKSVLPGNIEHIFTFGHSGGGAQSSIVGASGDCRLYFEYLESIGAAIYYENGKYISDSIYGTMCWCPITSLDYANEAYEWNMGQYSSKHTRNISTWKSILSKDLANAYAIYINKLELKNKNGKILKLFKTDKDIYTSGSYYNFILKTIENSLSNFLSDTKFPYTETTYHKPKDSLSLNENISLRTYKTVADYIMFLNSNEKWVIYDEKTNTINLTNIKTFATYFKIPYKPVSAFDDLNRNQVENYLFGNEYYNTLHFDGTLANILRKNKDIYSTYSDWNSNYIKDYANDMNQLDKFGNSIYIRLNMYNPMYYLCEYYPGYKTSTPAKYWRINTGITQGDTALTVELNLALALNHYEGIKDVNFTTVWNQGHTKAERTGSSTENFINWIKNCTYDK